MRALLTGGLGLLAFLAVAESDAATKHRPASPVRPPAAAHVPEDVGPQQLSLTIYNNNLVMIQDIRAVDLPAGRSRIQFPGVSAAIRPETVSLTANGVSVVEQNFDYDLLTPAKMMEKQVGHEVQLVRTNPATGAQTTETATVLSVNSGVVLRIGKRIEALRDDGLPTRVVFSAIPENLRASPTLSVTVDTDRAGARPVDLSYLSTGLSWSAAYVAMYDDKAGRLNLQGWITIKNSSGTSFRDANTELIAGRINTLIADAEQGQTESRAREIAGSSPQTNTKQVGDFYAYRLPERVTVADQQTKQIAFLDINDARATKHYSYDSDYFTSAVQPEHATVGIDFNNADKPLPAGTVRVYMRDSRGDPKFVGEQQIGHMPAGSDVGIAIGDAFDVTVQPTIVSSEKLEKSSRYEMSYELRNARAETVRVRIRQGGLDGGKVTAESISSEHPDANNVAWDVPVPAHGSATLTATIETGR